MYGSNVNNMGKVEKNKKIKEVSCYVLWTAIKKIDHLEEDLLDYDNLDASTS